MKIKNFAILVAGLLYLITCAEKDEETMKLNDTNVPLETAFEYVKSSGGIDEYHCTLNDLTVLLMENHSAPVVTFMVTYHVGSRNEAIGHTGATHLLEHMMFKGTTNYNRDLGNDVVPTLQNIGAQINATTWMDRTNYFELLPSEHLELAVSIESDRMKNLLLRDEDRQPEMTVVRNEFERGENDPHEALDKNLWATAYQAHPYHHSTIGWRSDIEGVSTDRLRQFYETYYWPNNATVTIIGDFVKDEALQLVLEKFGKYPRSPEIIPEMYTTEPEQEGARRILVKRAGQTGIVGIAHKTPAGLSDDTYPIQLLSRILGGGKSSRLYKKIVDKGLATSLSIWDTPFHDNGLFITYAFLTPGTDHAKVEQIILKEYENIKKNGVADKEILRVKGQIRAEQAFSRDGSYSIASNLNEAIAIGDWTYYTNFISRIDEVSPADIQRVAKAYLDEDQSTTGYFIPKNDKASGGGGGGEPGNGLGPKHFLNAIVMDTPQENGGSETVTPSIAEQIVDSIPLEGLRLLTMQTDVDEVVTMRGSFLGGDMYNPEDNSMVADVTAAMLDQGTKDKSKFEISEALESVGARVSFSSDQYRVRFNARCLKDDVSLVLSLIAEQLREPAFNKKDLDTVAKRYVGNLKRSKDDTNQQAARKFLQTLYPDNHPNYPEDVDTRIADIEAITVKDLKSFHKKNYGLGTVTLVAVGDVDNKEISREARDAFDGWKTTALTIKEMDVTANSVNATKIYVTMTDKTSTDMYIGQPIGISRNNEDYYSFMVGSFILGGNFSARLMQTVRNEQGLTYGIAAWIGGIDDGNDGYWNVWGTFSPELLEKGYEASMTQLEKWVNDGVSAEELIAKKSTITGTFKVGLATTRGMVNQILTNAERGRPNSHLDDFPGIINALTLERVNEAIKRYVNLEKIVFVAAGSVDDEGNPLEK